MGYTPRLARDGAGWRETFLLGGGVSNEPEEEIHHVEVRVPVIRLPKLPTGEVVQLPERRRVDELREYLAAHLFEHRAALDAAQFRYLLDEYARYAMMTAAGVEEYPRVIVQE